MFWRMCSVSSCVLVFVWCIHSDVCVTHAPWSKCCVLKVLIYTAHNIVSSYVCLYCWISNFFLLQCHSECCWSAPSAFYLSWFHINSPLTWVVPLDYLGWEGIYSWSTGESGIGPYNRHSMHAFNNCQVCPYLLKIPPPYLALLYPGKDVHDYARREASHFLCFMERECV